MRMIKKGIKLAGAAIGDAWTYPKKQIVLSDFLLSGGIISKSRHDNYTKIE